jgi:hypothetical protein
MTSARRENDQSGIGFENKEVEGADSGHLPFWLVDIRSERAVSLARFLPEKGKIIMAHAIKHVAINVAIVTLATAFVLYQGWLIWDMISP